MKKSVPIDKNPRPTLTVLPLMLMTAALFMTLRNMPIMAETGLHMIVFNLITVFAFLIPVALVSAELATGWPKNGVYHWVEITFGKRLGFISVWLQWTQSLFGITSILAYVGGSFAYVLAPDWGSNRYFIAATIIIVYWLATFLNFKGTARSGVISSVALSLGVLLPTVLLIIAGALYAFSGNAIALDLSMTGKNLIPSLINVKELVLFLSFVFGFVGIEVSASHAREVVNPQRNFPIALFSAAILGFFLTLFGGLAIAVIVPADQIDSINGATQAFSLLMEHFGLHWTVPVIAFLIGMGAAGQVSTWIVGPIKGVWAAGKEGNLPPYFQKTNKNDVPVRLLVVQAIIISCLGSLFLFFEDVNSIFLILTSIAIIQYAMMYIIMFIAAIRLRYTQPQVHRAYKIPGGKAGIWIVCGIGGMTSLLCFFIGFIPPQPNLSGFWLFELLIAGVCLVTILAGWLILFMKKPQWNCTTIEKKQTGTL